MVKLDLFFANKVLQALDDTNCPWITCKKFGHLGYVIKSRSLDILKLYAGLLNSNPLIPACPNSPRRYMSSNGSTAISFHENLLFDQTTFAALTTAAGVDSSLSPITATPIVASPSATALNVTLRTLPNKSRRPLWSSTGSNPEHPIATPVVPIRVGINLLSEITIPTFIPARAKNSIRRFSAESIGSNGRHIILCKGILDLSIPALGAKIPFFIVNKNPGNPPKITSDSLITTSTKVGSIS